MKTKLAAVLTASLLAVVGVVAAVPVAVVLAQRAVQQQALESVCLQLTALDVAHRLEPAPSRVSLRKPYMRLAQG